MSQIAKIEPSANSAMTPMEMLDRAVSSGASPDTLEKLMNLQERWSINQARKAFDDAMADLRGSLKPIMKRQTGHTGKYEALTDISEVVDPLLSPLGLSYRWRVADGDDKRVKVTCIVTHRDGHREETTLSAAPDTTGSKNPIQAVGSAVTYLQRYTLKAALGLAAGKDDDAAASKEEEYDTTQWTEKLLVAGTDRDAIIKIGDEIKADKKIPPLSLKILRAAWAGAMKQANDAASAAMAEKAAANV